MPNEGTLKKARSTSLFLEKVEQPLLLTLFLVLVSSISLVHFALHFKSLWAYTTLHALTIASIACLGLVVQRKSFHQVQRALFTFACDCQAYVCIGYWTAVYNPNERLEMFTIWEHGGIFVCLFLSQVVRGNFYDNNYNIFFRIWVLLEAIWVFCYYYFQLEGGHYWKLEPGILYPIFDFKTAKSYASLFCIVWFAFITVPHINNAVFNLLALVLHSIYEKIQPASKLTELYNQFTTSGKPKKSNESKASANDLISSTPNGSTAVPKRT